jgi:hypothetical protein
LCCHSLEFSLFLKCPSPVLYKHLSWVPILTQILLLRIYRKHEDWLFHHLICLWFENLLKPWMHIPSNSIFENLSYRYMF